MDPILQGYYDAYTMKKEAAWQDVLGYGTGGAALGAAAGGFMGGGRGATMGAIMGALGLGIARHYGFTLEGAMKWLQDFFSDPKADISKLPVDDTTKKKVDAGLKKMMETSPVALSNKDFAAAAAQGTKAPGFHPPTMDTSLQDPVSTPGQYQKGQGPSLSSPGSKAAIQTAEAKKQEMAERKKRTDVLKKSPLAVAQKENEQYAADQLRKAQMDAQMKKKNADIEFNRAATESAMNRLKKPGSAPVPFRSR